MTAHATLISYNFEFVTQVGLITGQFVADDAPLATPPGALVSGAVSSFSLSFGSVVFDLGTMDARRTSTDDATDWTGIGGTFTSSSTPGASLILNTCLFVQCQAIWSGIPGITDGFVIQGQPLAVGRAVPEPGTLALLGLGLIGLGMNRRRTAN